MINTTEVSEQKTELQIKTLHSLINGIIGFISFIIILSLLLFIVGHTNKIAALIVLVVSAVSAYYIAKSFSLSYTTLNFEQGNLHISSETHFLSFFRNKILDKTEILGYEIFKSRYASDLVIYLKNRSPFTLTLVDKNRDQINFFFEDKIGVINKNNRLSTRSFTQVFIISFILLLIVALIQLTILVVYNYIYYSNYEHYFPLNTLHAIKLLIPNVLVILICNYSFYKLNVRIAAKGFILLVLGINSFLLFGGMQAWQEHSYEKYTVNKPVDVFNNLKEKIFDIKDIGSYNTEEIGYELTLKKRKRHKDQYSGYTQYLTAPLEFHLRARKLLWVGYEFKGSFKRGLKFSERKAFLEKELQRNKNKFLAILKLKAQFYEVVYSGYNSTFNKDKFLESTLTTSKGVTGQIIVIKPHFETFQQYKSKLFEKISWFALGILIALVTGASYAAYYR